MFTHAQHCSEHFPCVVWSRVHHTLCGGYYHPPLTDAETEAQSGEVVCARSHRCKQCHRTCAFQQHPGGSRDLLRSLSVGKRECSKRQRESEGAERIRGCIQIQKALPPAGQPVPASSCFACGGACNVTGCFPFSSRLETGQLSPGLQTGPSLSAEPGASSARAARYLPPVEPPGLSGHSAVTPVPPILARRTSAFCKAVATTES